MHVKGMRPLQHAPMFCKQYLPQKTKITLLHGPNIFKRSQVLNRLCICRVTDAGVIALVAQSPNLQQLSLYWNVHVTDTPLYKVASLCTQLTHLNLSGCKRITDKGLEAIAKTCHHLIDIDLTR